MIRRAGLVLGLALLSTTALAAGTVAPNVAPQGVTTAYQITPELSNQPGMARRTDKSLINPWGIAALPNEPLWININGSAKSGIFSRTHFKQDGKVKTGDDPTGIVVIPANPNGTADFNITEGSNTGPAQFAFVTEDGLLQGWNPSVDVKHAVTAIDRSGASSRFTGIEFVPQTRTLMLCDFTNGFVEMFDGGFNETGHFTDNTLPPNFEPFNARLIRGKIYVAFAQMDPATGEEVKGAGLGYIDVFDQQGNMLKQLVSQGALNAPWGMAIAPSGFGQFAGDLLVGNFGDGKINVYDPASGSQLGTLSDASGNPLVIDGLWGIKVEGSKLLFAAGPNDEANGLVGLVSVVPPGG
jgi:uncharacterized protein (TIGR03118 family)